MKKIFVFTLAVAMFGTFNSAVAQFRKVPAVVTESFKAKYPDTKNVEWSDKLTGFQADFEMKGGKYESKFNTNGEWQQTEREIGQGDLPASVKDGYSKSKFTDWELKAITWIDSKDTNIQYRLLIRKSDLEKKYLYFDKNGKLIKDVIKL